MRYHLFNVNLFKGRPGFISCQIAPSDSTIGADCIDVSCANFDDILQLIALANIATSEINTDRKGIPSLSKETIRRADKMEIKISGFLECERKT